MGLAFPSRLGDQVPASSEAPQNLDKLLRADLRGRKDQVATRVALEYLNRIKELRPGYLDGVKSLAKAGVVYTLSGAAALGVVGLSVWGGYKLGVVAAESGYGPQAIGALGATWAIASELGYKPLNALGALVVLAVRDAANRAAKWSVHQDERSIEQKEAEAKECHREIFNQLLAVYNDCAKNLSERYGQAELNENASERVELKQLADHLEERLPAIERLLRQFDLGKHEVEGVLQRLKDRIRFVQTQSCKLEPKKSAERMNADLIAGWSKDAIHQIAVPFTIKDRVAAAKQTHMGVIERYTGYGSALLSGAATFAVSSVALAALGAALVTYQQGFDKVQACFSNRTLPELSSATVAGMGGAVVLGVAAPTTAVLMKKITNHSNAIKANDDYVDSELKSSIRDLKTIYDGVKNQLELMVIHPEREKMVSAIKQRMPAIRREIQKLGLVKDPAEILGGLEKEIR